MFLIVCSEWRRDIGPPPQPWDVPDPDYYNYDDVPSRTIQAVNCGELRKFHTGFQIKMTGRVQCQRLNRFLTLRDMHGTTQVVIPEEVCLLVVFTYTGCYQLNKEFF